MAGLFAVMLGGAFALASLSAAGAAPAKGGGGSTTTTTTKSGKSGSSSAFAKLVIKAASVGHVQVETAGSATFQPGTDGEALHVGDTIQTDSVGLAEIDYAANTYTRLDVNTTFTIKKLTDSQGNRQVQGSLTSGQTWNRTVALTQSESFQQSGGGVTAAVAGTAFAVSCTSPTQCTFTGVVDNVTLTGSNGQTETLNPLAQCVATNGGLCATPTQLTPDQLALIQWITQNVVLDFTEHGLGNGVFQPFSGTVVVSGAVVQSFTPSTPNQGFTPTTAPAPPPGPPAPLPPSLNANQTLVPTGSSSACDPSRSQCKGIMLEDEAAAFSFTVNATDPNAPSNAQAFLLWFTALQNLGSGGAGVLTGTQPHASPATVTNDSQWDPKTVFSFAPNGNEVGDPNSDPSGTPVPVTGSFTVQAVNKTKPALTSQQQVVHVSVTEDTSPTPG
jgi:hypothetical protein